MGSPGAFGAAPTGRPSIGQQATGEGSIREQAEREAMKRFDRQDAPDVEEERISAEAERRIADARRQGDEPGSPNPFAVGVTATDTDAGAEAAAVPPEVVSLEPNFPAAEPSASPTAESAMAAPTPTAADPIESQSAVSETSPAPRAGLFSPTEPSAAREAAATNPFMSPPVEEPAPSSSQEPEPEVEAEVAPEPPHEVPFPPVSSSFDRSGSPPPDPARSKLLAELRQAELQLERRRAQEDDLANELKATEDRLAQSQERTAEALSRAAERLQEIEARAAEAEARAARAERLSRLKAEEVDRAERLRELLDRIADAEQRASDAEGRARDTVVQIGDPLMEIDPDSIFESKPGHVPVLDESLVDEPLAADASEGDDEIEAPDSDFDLPPVADADLDVAEDPSGDALDELERSEIDADAAAEADEPSPAPSAGQTLGADSRAGAVNVNTASYEDLRAAGLSVTQTGRMLAFRERAGRFNSLDELEGVPGFPRDFLSELKDRLTV